MTLHLVPFDVCGDYIKACFINPETISSIIIEKYSGDLYYVVIHTHRKDFYSIGFKNEADAENLMNEFIAACYYNEHGCENCSDYCCGARNEL